MPEAFTLGPLLVSTPIAAFVVAFFVARWFASRLATRWDMDAGWTRGTVDGALVAGLIAARLIYAAMYWPAYAAAPWTVLYFWQPGYLPVAGLAGGALYISYRLTTRTGMQRLRYFRAVATGFALGATLLAAVLVSMNWLSESSVLKAGDHVPDFELTNLQGEPAAFSELQGRGVVLNFWATWCPPCRREMPLLESTWNEYESKGVTVIGIALGESPDIVRPFVDSHGISYPIWVDPGDEETGLDSNTLLSRFGGVGLPTTIFIGPDGNIRDIHIGELSRALLLEKVPELAP